MTTDELHREMTASFEWIDARFERVDWELTTLRAEIRAEAETTRRHFDVMVERVEAHVRLVAEANAHHTTILDDHERRIQTIEKRK